MQMRTLNYLKEILLESVRSRVVWVCNLGLAGLGPGLLVPGTGPSGNLPMGPTNGGLGDLGVPEGPGNGGLPR